MVKYLQKPRIPIYRGGGPFGKGTKFILAFCDCFKGSRVIPNLVPYADKHEITLNANNKWVQDNKGLGYAVDSDDQESAGRITLGPINEIFSQGDLGTLIVQYRAYLGLTQIFGAIGTHATGGGTRKSLIACQIPADTSYDSVKFGWTTTKILTSGTLSNLDDDSIWIFRHHANGKDIWRDGIKVASNTDTDTLVLNTLPLEIFESYYGAKLAPNNSNEGVVSFCAVIDDAWTEAQIADFYSDPWWMIRDKSIFLPDTFPRFWSPPAPAVGANIVGARAADTEFDVPSPVAVLEETVVGTVAEIELDVPSPTSSIANLITAQIAETEFSIPDPSVTLAKIVGAELAEADLDTPSPSAVVANTVGADPAAVDLDVPSPTSSLANTVGAAVSEIEIDVPEPTVIAKSNIIAVAQVAEVEFDLPDPTAISAKTVVSEPSEAECEALSPSVDIAVEVVAEPAGANLEALSGSSIIEKTVVASPAEIELEAPNPGALVENTVGAQIAEIEVDVPSPTAIISTGVIITAQVAEAEIDVPGPSASLSKTVTSGFAEAELDLPNPTAAPANVAIAVTINAELDVPSPSSTLAKEVVFDVATVEIEVLSPSISEALIVSDVAEAVLQALAPSLTYGFVEISCPGLVGKIYKIIEKFGKEIYFKKELSRAYDPSTGIGGIDTVVVKRKITPPEVKRKYMKNDKVIIGEVEFYLSACELNFDPKPGLGIIIDGEEWEISKRRKIRDTSALNVYKITAKR